MAGACPQDGRRRDDACVPRQSKEEERKRRLTGGPGEGFFFFFFSLGCDSKHQLWGRLSVEQVVGEEPGRN